MLAIDSYEMRRFKVYGLPQVSYTVDGMSGRSFGDALIFASIKQATSFEEASNAYSSLIRARMKKAEDLGKALALASEILSSFSDKDAKSTDTVVTSKVKDLYAYAVKYGISVTFGNNNTITRAAAQAAQNDMQYAADREGNDLNIDKMALQNGMTKRDNAFRQAGEFIKKYYGASKTIIANLGD